MTPIFLSSDGGCILASGLGSCPVKVVTFLGQLCASQLYHISASGLPCFYLTSEKMLPLPQQDEGHACFEAVSWEGGATQP